MLILRILGEVYDHKAYSGVSLTAKSGLRALNLQRHVLDTIKD